MTTVVTRDLPKNPKRKSLIKWFMGLVKRRK